MNIPNPEMLLIAREIRGLTQVQLAEMSGVGQGSISRYENGRRTLSEEELQALANALSFPLTFFYRRGKIRRVDTGMFFHRQRHSLSATDQKRLDSQLTKYRLDIEELLQRANYDTPSTIPKYKVSDFGNGQEAVEAIANNVRSEWGMRSGPVSNLIAQLESASCFIFTYDFGTDKMDEAVQWIPPTPPIIMINSQSPGDRLRFSLAHALGHLVMHHGRLPHDNVETEADQFAAAFLMPADDIYSELQPVTIDHLLQLKKRWKVSMQALIVRAKDVGLITETRYTSLFQMLSRYGYRKDEPVKIEVEQPVLVKSLLSAYKENGYTNSDLAEITTLHLDEFRDKYYPEFKLAG